MRLLLVLGLSCLMWACLTASASAPPATVAGGDDVPELEVPVDDNEQDDTRDDAGEEQPQEDEETDDQQPSGGGGGGGGGQVVSSAPAAPPTTLPFTGLPSDFVALAGLTLILAGLGLRQIAPSASSSARLRSRPQR
jgi:hypothetical protein